MFNFDGRGKQKTNISLGGKTAKDRKDRLALVKEKKELRESREWERRKEKSGQRLKAIWRGKRDLVQVRMQCKSQWTADPINIPQTVREFLFFVGSQLDDTSRGKFEELCLMLDQAANFKAYFEFAASKPTQFILQFRRLLTFALGFWGQDTAPSRLFLSFLSLEKLRQRLEGFPLDLEELLGRTFTYLVESKGYYQQLETCFRTCGPDAAPALWEIAFLPFHVERSSTSSSAASFLRHLLALPNLLQLAGAAPPLLLASWLPAVLSKNLVVNSMRSEDYLINLLDLARPMLDSAPKAFVQSLLRTVGLLLDSLPRQTFSTDEGDEYEQAGSENALAKRLECFTDTRILRTLFSTEEPWASDSLYPITITCFWILNHPMLEFLRLRLLTALTYSTSAIPALLYLIKQDPSFANPDRFDPNSNFAVFLSVFSLLYSHVLLTLDDEEFMNDRSPVPLEDAKALISKLKRVVFALHVSAQHANSPLLNSLHRLLQFLADRSARRPFTLAADWTIPDLAHARQYDSEVAPLATILHDVPFLVPFAERVLIFRRWIEHAEPGRHFFGGAPIQIRRTHIFEDAYDAMYNLGAAWHDSIRIEFVNPEGEVEAGVGAGPFKDFLTEFVKTAFTQYGLFTASPDGTLYPNPSSATLGPDHLQQLEFLGMVTGKAVSEGIVVDLPLANFFLAKLLGKLNSVNDLVFLDPVLHRNLVSLKKLNQGGADYSKFSTFVSCLTVSEDQLAACDLDFQLSQNDFGVERNIKLIPNGDQITVNKANLLQYIHLVAHYHLNLKIRLQSQAFLKGFSRLVNPKWIRLFSQQELQELIAGSGALDVADLRHNIALSNYAHEDPQIQWFFEVVTELEPLEQQKLLKFVTSCSRPPLLGFRYMHPPFSVRRSEGDSERLPTASTCFNTLKLPPYETKQKLKEKLLTAIQANSSFDFS